MGFFSGWGPILWSFWNFGSSHRWLCSCLTRLGCCARPKPFCEHCPLSFLHSVVLPDLRVCVQLWGPVLATSSMGPIFPSTSRKVFIFLIIVGWGWSLVLHGVHFISCIVLSLLKICVPCMEVIFTSTSTTSTGSQHLNYPCRRLHSG